MKDLMAAYDEARFGKRAADDDRGMLSRVADYFAMSKLTPDTRKLRDTVEASIREERRLRAQAKDEVIAAKRRIKAPADTGGLSWITDIVRSAVPGLAPAAAPKDDGITKVAVELDEGPSTPGTLAHLLAAGTGAGLGAHTQMGTFGGMGAAQRAAATYPKSMATAAKTITGTMTKMSPTHQHALGQALREMDPKELALLAQKAPGNPISKVLRQVANVFSGAGRKPEQAAAKKLVRELAGTFPRAAGGTKSQLVTAIRELAEQAPEAIRRGQSSFSRGAGTVLSSPGWKRGAGIGAAAATLPFVLYNLVRARKLRSQGGLGTAEAYNRAVKLLTEASKVRGERENLVNALPK
jgi:hypothetical protein